MNIFQKLRHMASVSINGMTLTGNSIKVVQGNVFIDGKPVEVKEAKSIVISVDGSVDQLNVDACDRVAISGSAGSVSTMSGDVKCGNVSGSVTTMSGDVDCGSIGGNVSTMSGDISQK
jgi:hypothetical protein